MVRRFVYPVAWIAVLAILMAGCGARGHAGAGDHTGRQGQGNLGVSAPANGSTIAPTQGSPAVPAGGDQPGSPVSVSPQDKIAPLRASDVKLVMSDEKWIVGVRLLYPEGWQVDRSAIGDMLQIHKAPFSIMVLKRQLRGQAAPRSVEEKRKEVESWAPGAQIKQVPVPGAVSAFETSYVSTAGGASTTVLDLSLYGTTRTETVTFSAPSDLFPEWEPVFRRIMASYQHGNLDAQPLPGRP